MLELTGDDHDGIRRQKKLVTWDRKRKKFVGERETAKIRSESGQLIAASYKTGIYDDWVAKNKLDKFGSLGARKHALKLRLF